MRGGGHCETDTVHTGTDPKETRPGADDFFRLLSTPERRRVLYFLQEHSEAKLSELCDVLAGWKAVEGSGVTNPESRERIRASLHHTDLPKFEAVGVLSYDRDHRKASLRPLPDELSSVLDDARRYEGGEEHPDG